MTGLDFLRALSTAHSLEKLPHRLEDGDSAQLVILWDITDCAELVEGEEPQVALRSVIGTTSHETLDSISSPAYDLAALRRAGICPAP